MHVSTGTGSITKSYIYIGFVGSTRRVTGCSTAPDQHLPNVRWSMKGYNILKGYPLSRQGDPGFTQKVFEAHYVDNLVSDDCM